MILIADDSKKIRDRLADLISSEPGLEIAAEAKDGYEAIQMLETHKPDVMILDLQLPRLNGFEVLKKSKVSHPGTKIIILTNRVNNTYRKTAEELGCYSFYDKSHQFDNVVEDLIKLKKVEVNR
jgi:DNA-binding NarL/FixJ family response regulator